MCMSRLTPSFFILSLFKHLVFPPLGFISFVFTTGCGPYWFFIFCPLLGVFSIHGGSFVQVVSLLEKLGFDKETIGSILCRCPELFATSIERTLTRKLKFLAAIGVSKVHFPRVIKKYPEFLVSDPERTLLPR